MDLRQFVGHGTPLLHRAIPHCHSWFTVRPDSTLDHHSSIERGLCSYLQPEPLDSRATLTALLPSRQAWGEAGYGRIAIGTNNVGFEERMSYANPVLPSPCTNGPRTCEHGERRADCSCKCYPPWQGVSCGLCLRDSIACSNGGVLDATSCTCACPSGYFGATCAFYVRAFWTGATTNARLTLRLAWSLPLDNNGTLHDTCLSWPSFDDRHGVGSFFQRVAAVLGSDGDNTAIAGYTYPISGKAGSQDISFSAESAFGICSGERLMHWALFVPLGLNEFRTDLGYSLDPKYRPPPLLYNCASNCVSGGHVPPAGTRGLCPTAVWHMLNALDAGGATEHVAIVVVPSARAHTSTSPQALTHGQVGTIRLRSTASGLWRRRRRHHMV